MSVSNTLLSAYQETHYHIYSEPQFILKIGIFSDELSNLHTLYNARSSAVITAWNPYSKIQPISENHQRQQQLCERASATGLRFISALGLHPSGNWPGEESLFILDIRIKDALTLAREFEQNAIVFSSKDAVPEIRTLF